MNNKKTFKAWVYVFADGNAVLRWEKPPSGLTGDVRRLVEANPAAERVVRAAQQYVVTRDFVRLARAVAALKNTKRSKRKK